MVNKLVFIYFAMVILASAVLMITRLNPIHSVMFMLLLFFHIAGVFVLLNAEFLAAVQLIVYAGAILILYLIPLAQALRALIAAEIVLLVSRGTFSAGADQPMRFAGGAGVRELGEALYQKYLVPFEIASVILLVGLIGAVMLAKKSVKE